MRRTDPAKFIETNAEPGLWDAQPRLKMIAVPLNGMEKDIFSSSRFRRSSALPAPSPAAPRTLRCIAVCDASDEEAQRGLAIFSH
ncbi:hypothetical protein NU688_08150 [Variovorax sp. ZS18.2.2]|uniref:hypothetical protein n=1 Tax=Variovorax sp. ZS18.2.2 TaxID=2971255 RepID=UPI002151D340|nr:hypothetical protein [Variovorax sp. ZS18.2.2]MCR6476125.1 hypothetical protein [Variovorax sp. ZS18.2.2]